jgi:hypothetical protein
MTYITRVTLENAARLRGSEIYWCHTESKVLTYIKKSKRTWIIVVIFCAIYMVSSKENLILTGARPHIIRSMYSRQQ